MSETEKKYQELAKLLISYEKLAVAFSGGADSALLLYAARQVLGPECVLAVTVRSELFPERELAEAVEFCNIHDIPQEICEASPLSIEGFCDNPVNRCYICKKDLLGRILCIAGARGFFRVAEGSNLDDEGDYRPGLLAVREAGVESPLREAELCKREIRELSGRFGLATANKPSFACLASRFAYGERIDSRRLAMVGRAEEAVRELGFTQVRVRVHGGLARIEVEPDEIFRLAEPACRSRIDMACRQAGFDYVALDLAGYRTGSMNEVLGKDAD